MRPTLPDSTVKILRRISDLDPEGWDACATGSGAYNPFTSYAFLSALEDSNSACQETGWQPFHLAVERDSTLVGVVPMYLKSHSQGEYVFDYAWADAWHRAGGQYYPKLQASIPFTPATGPRLLCREPNDANYELLLSACLEVADQVDVSSLHMTFMQPEQWDIAERMGFLTRMDQQFHWHNPGYDTFDAFLADLSSKKRKNLRRERREAIQADIDIEWCRGAEISEAHWDDFYQFYLDTGTRKWGSPYLTRQFFTLISERMANDVLLILAKRQGRYIAGALNFVGGDTLFGRNWGCIEDHRFLHFEVCYYQAIDYAIALGLKHVEAGAQGGHKVIRGYLPKPTLSAHWIKDQGFSEAVARFLKEERAHVSQDMEAIAQRSPFNANVDISQIRAID